jgi:hypothetical protein
VTAGRLVRFYHREGCHLCEEMAAFVFRHWPEIGQHMVWVDVDADPALQRRYGSDVPVLVCDGEEVCRHAAVPEAMHRYFGQPAYPV